MAKVWLHVGGLSSQQKVAVAPSKSLDGKVLMAIDVSKEEELQLLVDCGIGKLEVCAVKTRAERKLRRKEWVEEQKCLESEQPKCNVSPLMEQSVESDLLSPREEQSGVLDKQTHPTKTPMVEQASMCSGKTSVVEQQSLDAGSVSERERAGKDVGAVGSVAEDTESGTLADELNASCDGKDDVLVRQDSDCISILANFWSGEIGRGNKNH